MSLFTIVALGFLFGAIAVVAIAVLVSYVPGALAERRLAPRLEDVATTSSEAPAEGESLVRRAMDGPLPAVDRLVARTATGSRLSKVIEQSGVKTTPSAIVLMSVLALIAGTLVAMMFVHLWAVALFVGLLAGSAPLAFIHNRRNARLKKFEEQFPEALDLISRALRAGHAFQTALGMAGDELKDPVGPEFKKTFDQQNFGLPLRDALFQLAERVPNLDVQFFVTAVLIQRETGGNLSEILDNLSHVVRERFKIKRQVRVHTAHGRFTAFVLLALPAALALVLTMLARQQMEPLFYTHMGQMMLLVAAVLQTIGFFWIRRVIKIEV